jgi:hypothetical protein
MKGLRDKKASRSQQWRREEIKEETIPTGRRGPYIPPENGI